MVLRIQVVGVVKGRGGGGRENEGKEMPVISIFPMNFRIHYFT